MSKTLMIERSSSRPRSMPMTDGAAFTSVATVTFLTLFVIMAICTAPQYHGTSIVLPRVDHPVSMWRAGREDAAIVGVMRDGKVFFRSDQVNNEQLPTAIRRSVDHGGEHKLYVKADGRARWGSVARVVDAAREAGIVNVAFLVDQKRSTSVAP